jgi:hypothetical protein
MITIRIGSITKRMTERDYAQMKHQLKGWQLVNETPVQKKEPTPAPELTREEMIDYLKTKGIKVHWNLSDEKIKERYDSETKIN